MAESNLNFIFLSIWQIFKVWWWILPPLILWRPFCFAWLWWRRELWEKKQEYVVLEITPPAEVIQPISAMEQVFSAIWGIYSGIKGIKHFKKKWWWGRKLYHYCFEIISIGDRPHILMRIRKEHQDTIEAALYSQYPELEIREVDDYTRYISQNVPNKDWNIYGLDEMLINLDVYPIKTYRMFFEEKPELIKEERKRIDPLNTLFEGMSKLDPKKEQLWLQIRITPVTSNDNDYMERGKKLIDKLVYRRGKEVGLIKEAAEVVVGAPSPAKKGEVKEGFIPPEMKLTPREREVVKAIEDKIDKPAFETNIRLLYFGTPDIFRFGRRALGEQFFNSFSIRDLNSLKKWSKTKTRIYHFFIKRRLYLRRRNMFWRYVLRETPLYPRKRGTYILNTEELTTLFHPPIAVRKIGTFLPTVKAKKGEAPTELPTEETQKEERPPEKEVPSGPIRAKKGEAPPELPAKETEK